MLLIKLLRVARLVTILFLSLAAFSQGTGTPVDKTEAEKWREDLRFMADEMPLRHKNLFHSITREQFEFAVGVLGERIPTMSREQIIVQMARIVAMVGDGHTNIAPTRDPKIGFHSLPVKLYFFKNGLYVRAADEEHADIVGARVLYISGVPVDAAYQSVRNIIGRDNEMDAKYFAAQLLAIPEILYGLNLSSDPEKATFVVQAGRQQKIVRLAPAGPAELIPPDTDTTWMPRSGWVDARDTARSPTPLWLKDPLNKYWFEYLKDSKTVYVQLNQVGNKDDETLEAFCKRLFAFVDSNPAERFVLDLRLNRGGNGALNRPLLLGIIRSKVDQRGKLFTIVGRSTWSAAQFLVNDLERFTNTIFVGEPTGGKINSYGDSRKITLPNSGITVRVSSLWWQQDERDARQWTAPDIAANLTFDAYRNNIDPAMKAILNYVPKKPLADILSDALAAGNGRPVSEQFLSWKYDPANEYQDAEPILNTLGYKLLANKRVGDAITIFRLNAEEHPQSANVFDSLADAYLADNDRERAIQNYEKAIALDPKMESAIEALKKLRGQ